jgi:quercetin dioxygenase-like cupin family protein
MRRTLIGLATVMCGATLASATATQQSAPPERVYRSPGGVTLQVLLDQAGLGGTEVELGELTFPPNSDSSDHQHGVAEVFYVLEGELEHIVNGRSMKLAPGMVGSVRPPDTVRHKTGAGGARALVIWAPGGEMARVTARWRAQ